MVGHINKDGAIAGPKVLEHMVDCVLYFEGDVNSSYRLLRAAKNRFGSTNEIGVFEMMDAGLIEVPNPSQMLLAGRPEGLREPALLALWKGPDPFWQKFRPWSQKQHSMYLDEQQMDLTSIGRFC